MGTIVIGAGLALALALLVSIHRRLDALPARAGADRRERAPDAAAALGALKQATTLEVATITAALRSYEEHVAEQYQQMLAAAEMRARVAERRSADAGIALSTASELVRELRALVDGLADRPSAVAAPSSPRANAAAPVIDLDDARKTVPMGAPATASAGDEPEEELTAVAARPLGGTAGPFNGLRLQPRSPAAAEGKR